MATNNPFAAIETVGADGLRDVLDMCRAARLVPMIYGPPGVGKSTIVAKWARDNGYFLYDIRLAQLLPEHLSALQYPDAAREHVLRLTPSIVADMFKLRDTHGKPGVIFPDELTLAGTETLSAAIELLLDRSISGFRLPDDTMIVAAGNRPQDTASACTLDPPVRSRLVSCVYIPTPREIADYMRATFPGNALADACAEFVTSHQASPIIKRDEIGDDAAFFTPRGLESAIRMAAPLASDVANIGKNKRAQIAFTGCVGRSFFASFASWASLRSALADPGAILANATGAPLPETQQAATAQLDALRDYCAADGIANAWQQMATYASRHNPEFFATWAGGQSKTTIEAIGASARGARLLRASGAGLDPSDAGKARRAR